MMMLPEPPVRLSLVSALSVMASVVKLLTLTSVMVPALSVAPLTSVIATALLLIPITVLEAVAFALAVMVTAVVSAVPFTTIAPRVTVVDGELPGVVELIFTVEPPVTVMVPPVWPLPIACAELTTTAPVAATVPPTVMVPVPPLVDVTVTPLPPLTWRTLFT